MEEKVTIEGESMREEKATMERGTPMENDMKKGGLEDTDKKAGDAPYIFDPIPVPIPIPGLD